MSKSVFVLQSSPKSPKRLSENKMLGCVIEDQVNYAVHNLGGDSAVPTTQESPQDCAEHCVATQGALFWVYNRANKECWLKTSDSDRRYHTDVVSGNRACGLSNRTISARLTSVAVAVSERNENFPPRKCANGDPSTICVVESSPAPWLAIYLGSRVKVNKVEIKRRVAGTRNRDGGQDKPWINKVWITDSLPSSGAHILNISILLLEQELFTGGTLLGSFKGPPTHSAVTSVEATSAKPSPRGHYVILQKNSAGLVGDNQQLSVAELVVFGRYGAETEGYSSTCD